MSLPGQTVRCGRPPRNHQNNAGSVVKKSGSGVYSPESEGLSREEREERRRGLLAAKEPKVILYLKLKIVLHCYIIEPQ